MPYRYFLWQWLITWRGKDSRVTATAFLYLSFAMSLISCSFPCVDPHESHPSADSQQIHTDTYCVSGTLTGAAIIAVNETSKTLCSNGPNILVVGKERQANKWVIYAVGQDCWRGSSFTVIHTNGDEPLGAEKMSLGPTLFYFFFNCGKHT